MNDIVSLISSVGFPIVVCLFLLKYVKDFFTQMTQTLSKIEKSIELINDYFLIKEEKKENEKTSL